jgi:tetratricopeptide (TPR) repeat protein
METIDTDNEYFQEALKLVQYTHQSVFLTGKAGTGKSTFLRYICQTTKKKYIVLAPTGIAAINVGGSTLHSFFKLPFYPLLPDDANMALKDERIYKFFRYDKGRRQTIEKVELIIIDEISMVRADIIDAIDRILRVFSHNIHTPFGGKQVLFVGDVYQLEPVLKKDELQLINRFYPTPYFFSARVFAQMELVSIELQKVYRQTDKTFVGLLDHIRNNTLGNGDLRMLNERYRAEGDGEEKTDDMTITLASRRDTVDNINDRRLEALDGELMTFTGEITGDFPESSLPTPQELSLKVGAQIIFIKNDMNRQWVNGTIGIIEGFDEESGTLYILTEDGRNCDVQPELWRNIRYSYDEKEKIIKEEELGTYKQYPIKLAWAITIHKSQGLTFSRVVIDLTGGAFAGGQTYVALSRCTSLEGITLRRSINRSDIFVRPEIVNFAHRFNDRSSIDRAMKEAQADLEYVEAAKAFEKGDMGACLDSFLRAIHSKYIIERPDVLRLLRRKLNVVNVLRGQVDELKRQLEERRVELAKLAGEYLAMGDMCVNEAHDDYAAVANYSKAIKLDPTCVDAYLRRGKAMEQTDSYRALQDYGKAIALSPNSFDAAYQRGCLRLELHDAEGAIADLDKATSIDKYHADAHEKFGDALMLAGKEDAANRQWTLAEQMAKRARKKRGKSGR